MNWIQKYSQFVRRKWWTCWLNRIGLVIIVLILLFLFFDSLLMPIVTRHGKESRVPGIIGLNMEQAQDLLKKLDMGVRVISEEYNPDKPSGVILYQNPDAGSLMKKGRNIRVTISKGGKLVEVPKLKGVSLRQAEIMLAEKGLEIGDISWVYNDSFPQEVVISATPSFGTTVPKGISVRLTVNKFTPEGAVIVPKFVGKNIEEAQNIAKESGLEIGIIRYKVDNTLLPRTVLEQIPKSGAEVNRGSSVELVISIIE
ncbi:MAG: PASTA domain-containing protein [Candidatus Zixiibacteriota bacterium]